MNKFRTIALILCAALAQLASAATDDLPPFYQELLPDGAWFKLAGQSWVWQPQAAQRDAAWRPYLHAGNWTRYENNWFWASSYAWGAIVFHYGRWYRHTTTGWVWVPGTQWCPAWVDWQLTDTHSGWTPLPPDNAFFAEQSLTTPERDWSLYTFVPNAAFLKKNLQPYVCEGSAFGETAVAQLAGPAEDRVGIEPVVALYTLAPIAYETAPTIIIRDRRDSLWLPAPYGGYGHPFRYPSGWRYHPPRGCH